MTEKTEKQREVPQRTTLIDPIVPCDQSQVKEAMIFYERYKPEESGLEILHEQRKLPITREQFLEEMTAIYGKPLENNSEEESEYSFQEKRPSQLDLAKVARFEGMENAYPKQAVYVSNGYLSNTTAAQETAITPISAMPAISLSAGKKDGLVPLDLVKKMKKHYPMCVLEKEIYVYSEGCYHVMAQHDMESLIWMTCETEVEECGSKAILTGTYQLLLVDPMLKVSNLSQPENLINFQNGMLRLDDGAFLQHTPLVFTTFTLQCDYCSVGECPVFDKYLYDVAGGDPDLVDRIWEIIGCCLSQEDIKALFVLQGVPNSGKSVITNTIEALFPDHVKSALGVHALGTRFAEKEYKGKVLCISADLAGDPLSPAAVGSLKRLSGRDVICSDVKYGDPVKFRFKGRILLVTNHPLLLKKEDPAFFERIVVVPFRYSIPEERRDYELEKKLLGELSAIARKAIAAYFRLRNNGFRFSGNYTINSLQLYGDAIPVTDPVTLVYLFLQHHFEPGTEQDLVAIEQACEAFNNLYHMGIKLIQFSALFCSQAVEMYGAEKVRSRLGGCKNARSCLKGIKVKK